MTTPTPKHDDDAAPVVLPAVSWTLQTPTSPAPQAPTPTRHGAASTGHGRGIAGEHHHRIHELPPAPSWLLVVDESGGFQHDGHVVGVLFSGDRPVPDFPERFHATEADDANIDRWMQHLLDTPCGILGLRAAIDQRHPQARFLATLHDLIATVLRLLPIAEGQRTHLRILVEQRGGLDVRHSLPVVLSELLRQAHLGDPARMALLDVKGAVAAKGEHRGLVAPDLVAHAWYGGTRASRNRLRRSGLTRDCLLDLPSNVVRAVFDALERTPGPTGAEWSALFEAARPNEALAAPLAVALNQLALRCRQDVDLWRRYVSEALRHLDSKAIRLPMLKQQLDWLEQAKPHDAVLPKALRLVWAVANLEAHNHAGHVEDPNSDRAQATDLVHALGEALVDELPALVCQADLVCAVAATNRFDFQDARSWLIPWDAVPLQVPGLRHWGRLQSSFGQHAAFQGDHQTAEYHFQQALAAFARLSDPHDARLESSQTATYRAINAMDAQDPHTVTRLQEADVPLTPSAIRQVATAPTPAQRYTHHVLLRYLCAHDDAVLRDAYLEVRDAWTSGDGHPWELVELYRYLLARPVDPEAATAALQRAHTIAFDDDHGPTVRFIGHVIQAIGARNPALQLPPEPDGDDRLALPLAPWEVLDAADTYPSELALLRAALPFNFR